MKHVLLLSLLATPAFAADERPWVGDPVNGTKLYKKECVACHGEGGSGGRSGVSLTDSGRMNLLRDDQIYAMVRDGVGIKKEKSHKFAGKLSDLDVWDVVAYQGTRYLPLAELFPTATHYISKENTIDQHGTTRIEETTKKPPKNKTGPESTFYKKEGAD